MGLDDDMRPALREQSLRAAQSRDLVSLHVHLHEIRHEAARAVCELVEAGLWSDALLGHVDAASERRIGGDATAKPLGRARIRLHREHAGRAAAREDESVEAGARAEVEACRARYAELTDVPRELAFVDAQPVAGVPVEVDLHHEAASEPERQSP